MIDTASDAVTKDKISQEFIEALVKVHQIPLEAFGEIGLHLPESPADIALNHYRRCYDIFLQQMGDNVVPLMDFTWEWLKRRVPAHRNKACGITGDAGQFMFDDNGLLALIDFEQFYVGDPIAEFAGMRLRDIIEPLDIEDLIARYQRATGEHVDRNALEYHTVGFSGVNGWLLWPTSVSQDMELDHVAYLGMAIGTSRWIVNAMAEVMNITFDEVHLPEDIEPFAPLLPYAHLIGNIPKLKGHGRYAEYNEMKTLSLAQYVDRWNRYGAWFKTEDLKNVSRVLGKTFSDYDEAQKALSKFVTEVGEEYDEVLARYFNGWLQMQEFLVKDCGPQTFLVGRNLKPVNVPWLPGTGR